MELGTHIAPAATSRWRVALIGVSMVLGGLGLGLVQFQPSAGTWRQRSVGNGVLTAVAANSDTASRRVYLAGADIFRPDAVAYGKRVKALCRARGFECLYPLDERLPSGLSGHALADSVFRQNLLLIRKADLIMADLNWFRGQEPDPGTSFEVGFAAALGKPVWAYTSENRSLADQEAVGRVDSGVQGMRHLVDARGWQVEDFGLNVNLMLACSSHMVIGGPSECLDAMAAAAAGESTPTLCQI
mmetsp:Transcript_63977/g.187146  ORF Transcript_63977/g.187146 Transcript_63977/m.187146 type:complete len:244 (-) Transcript_63977:80-811(-)